MELRTKMDTRTARNAISKGAEKYHRVMLSEKDFKAIFKLFGDAIAKANVYNRLLSGDVVVERIGVGELVLTSKGNNPEKYVFELPESLI